MAETPYNPEPFLTAEQAETSQRRSMLLGLLRGRWHWAILLAFLLGVAGGYLGYHSQPDMYSVKSYIDIKPDYDSEVPFALADPTLKTQYVNYVQSERRRLRSLELAQSAMGQPEWQANLAKRPDALDEVTISDYLNSIEISELELPDTRVYISFDNEDPATAKAMLNAHLAAYTAMQRDVQNDRLKENVRLLKDRERDLELNKTALQNQIKQLLPDESIENLRSRRTRLQGQLAKYEIELSDLQIALEPFLNQNDDDSPEARRERMMQSTKMQELLQEKQLLEERLSYMIEVLGRGEQMRDVMQVKRAISAVDRRIAEYETAFLESPGDAPRTLPEDIAKLNTQRLVMVNKITELNSQISDLTEKINSVAGLQMDLEETQTRIYEARDQIAKFQYTIQTVDENDISRIEVGPFVETPTQPWNAGKRRQLAGVGAIGGCFVGFGLVMLVGLFDRRMRHVSDTAAGMPDTNVLGILPTLPADLTDPEDADTAAHCVHHIRTLLQIGGSDRVFSITSPAAGSGKSSLATALGMSFATSGARTLVIDCDLVGAGLSRRMGTLVHEPLDKVISKQGMLDEAHLASALTTATAQGKPLDEVLLEQGLMDEEQVETAVRLQRDSSLGILNACAPGRLRGCVGATDIENFYILPVGRAKPSDASKLSPAAIRELVRQAREAFDIVLIDTGPVLGSLEASIVAAESDATVLIVSRGDQKSLASRTLEQLRSVRANIAGIVFNHALERDLSHTSYASVVSQERRSDRVSRKRRLDEVRSARLGPLGSAVASVSDDDSGLDKLNGEHTNGHPGDGGSH